MFCWELMRIRSYFLIAIAGLLVLVSETGIGSLPAQMASQVALTGQVSSTEEGQMEGVLVSAKKAGSTITITVVSDQHGRYAFPRQQNGTGPLFLDESELLVTDLDGLGTVEISSAKEGHSRSKTPPQRISPPSLRNAEWILSVARYRTAKLIWLDCAWGATLCSEIVNLSTMPMILYKS